MRVPPGRAGRLWLLRRLEIARRGAEVLEQKRQTLLRERQRTASALAAADAEWSVLAENARRWNDRALALAGPRRLRLARRGPDGTATATVTWRNTLGAVIPDAVAVRFDDAARATAPAGDACVALTAQAHRDALAAAAAAAAARAAHDAVERELVATSRRLRAIEHRWIPEHERALHELEITLAERELEDVVRARFALEQRSPGRPLR